MICERSLDVAAFAPMKTHDIYCIKRKASILVIIDKDYLLLYLLVCLFVCSIIFTVRITLLTNICPQSSSVNSNFKRTLSKMNFASYDTVKCTAHLRVIYITLHHITLIFAYIYNRAILGIFTV